MSSFHYKSISEGEMVSGTVTARDINEAAALLRERGFMIIELDEAKRGFEKSSEKSSSAPFGAGRLFSGLFISGKSVEHAMRHLSVLLRGGVPILSALEICAAQATGRLKTALLATAEGIRSGHTLEESMRKEMAFLGDLALGLVKVGESNGALDAMFEYSADLLERKRKIKNDIIQALTYPAIVTVMSLSAGFYITTVQIPNLTPHLST